MKQIKLTQNKFAIVDDEDFEFLSQWKWYFSGGYAIRTIYKNGLQKQVIMHRVINKTPEGFETDHINRNKLDNRKGNLRSVTNRQNQLNVGLRKSNTSGSIGVYWRKERNKWRVQIHTEKGYVYLGHYKELWTAKLARKWAEKIYYVG